MVVVRRAGNTVKFKCLTSYPVGGGKKKPAGRGGEGRRGEISRPRGVGVFGERGKKGEGRERKARAGKGKGREGKGGEGKGRARV